MVDYVLERNGNVYENHIMVQKIRTLLSKKLSKGHFGCLLVTRLHILFSIPIHFYINTKIIYRYNWPKGTISFKIYICGDAAYSYIKKA